MTILFLLIPLGLILLALSLWGFFWAVRAGQFDDLQTPAIKVLLDPEENLNGDEKCKD